MTTVIYLHTVWTLLGAAISSESLSHIAPLDKQRRTRRYIKIWFIFLFFDGVDCVVGIQSGRVRAYLSSVSGTLLWSSETAREHTWGADRLAWVISGSHPSLERPADLSHSLERPANLCLQSKITSLIFASKSLVFSVYGWLSELTYFRFFFRKFVDLICERNYLSLYPQAINYIFLFPVKPLCWFYLATALNLLNSSSPAKLVYYKLTREQDSRICVKLTFIYFVSIISTVLSIYFDIKRITQTSFVMYAAISHLRKSD